MKTQVIKCLIKITGKDYDGFSMTLSVKMTELGREDKTLERCRARVRNNKRKQ